MLGLVADLSASVVNFAIQIASCFAVAMASGFPPIIGFLSVVVGAFVVAPLSSCRFQVTSCAASLIALTWVVIDEHGVILFGMVVAIAGIYQLIAALFKSARWFGAVSPSLICGLMTGIGAIVSISQLLNILGTSSRGNGLENLKLLWPAGVALFTTERTMLPTAAVGTFAALIVFLWPKIPLRAFKIIPGALAALVLAALVVHYGNLPVQRSHVSGDFLGHLRFPDLETLAAVLDWRLFWAALPIAFLASTESLLATTILDRRCEGKSSDLNRELFAQGAGNIVCGLIGGLPMLGSTSRGVASIEAGAHSRFAAILPGLWTILLLSLYPAVLEQIPVIALSGVLLYVGIRLMDYKAILDLRRYGTGELIICLTTIITMLAVDVSTGILIGFFVCLAKIVFTFSADLEIVHEPIKDDKHIVSLKGAATFLALPKLKNILEGLPSDKTIEVSLEKVYHIDYGCAEFLTQWGRRVEADGGKLEVDWQRVNVLYTGVRNLLDSDEDAGWLTVTAGPLKGQRHKLSRCTLIGKSLNAHVTLLDEKVSKEHAVLFGSDHGKMVLFDLHSETGTWIGDEKIQRQDLSPGSRFRINETEFELQSLIEPDKGGSADATNATNKGTSDSK